MKAVASFEFPAIAQASRPMSMAWVSRIVMVGATLIVIGILWDISWHRTIGRDTFWTPAHIAIQLGGLIGGFTAGWLVIRTTFFGTPEDKAATVKLWGLRAPLGAWLTIWGCLAMLTSAPFDNWWHDAYGLDVKIISPPHAVLAFGMWSVVGGCLLLVLREQNNGASLARDSFSLSPQRGEGWKSDEPIVQTGGLVADHPSPSIPLPVEGRGRPDSTIIQKASAIPGRWFFIYGAGVLLAMAAVFLTEMSWPNDQRTARFLTWSAATYPFYLLGMARASKFRWGATMIALVYMLIGCGMTWVLPLFAGSPKLGPIYNPVERFVPLAFPLLLVVPAFAIDLVRNFVGQGRKWWRDIIIVVLCAAAFVALFAVTQWHFSEFLIGPKGQNWFFGADRHWGYTEGPNEWRLKFWHSPGSRDHAPIVAMTYFQAFIGALISSGLGLIVGNWMSKVRR